jgi:CelD/BcsL family acetyltransferase involved in cellulose biosynthesis
MLEVQEHRQAGVPWSAGYQVEYLADGPSFLDVEAEWNRLVDEAAVEHPFLRHEWLRVWWDCFGEGNRLAVVLVRANGRLVAAAPLMSNGPRMYGLRARRLQTIYNVHTPRLGLIVAPGHEGAYRAVWRHIAERDDWDVLELNQLPEGSPTLDRITELASADGFPCERWSSGDAPYVPLRGSWADYFEGLAAKHRSNLRNRLKRLSKIGDVELETLSEPGPALEAALQDGLRIEAAGWKGEEGTAIRCEDDIRGFYSRYAQAAARRDLLRLQFLVVGGTRIAFAYSIVHAGKLFLLKTGYDPEYSKYSPFNVLLRKVLEDCFDSGLDEFEFLGVFDRWKESWAELARPHCWAYVFAKTPTARLIRSAKFGVIPKVKQILGVPESDGAKASGG